MKIAIDISQIAFQGTGVAEYTKNLVRHLLLKKNFNYLLYGISFGQKKVLQEIFAQFKAINPDIETILLPFPQAIFNLIWNRYHLLPIEKFIGRIDLVHSSDWLQPKTQAAKITTIHDLVVYLYPEFSHPYIISTQKKRLFWVKKECDYVLADSISTKNDLLRILHFASDKIEVVYPGINEQFKPAPAKEVKAVKLKYALYDEYIIAVGKQEPRKNLAKVVGAFKRFLNHYLITPHVRPIQLVIVGSTGWGQKIVPSKYVKIIGFVDKSDLPALYSGSQFLVYASIYEGFGLPILEAASCQCPVITSNRGSLKELAKDTALFIDPYDEEDIAQKMIQLYVDKTLRSGLINKGFQNSKNFTWEKASEQVLEIYNKLLK